MMNSNFSPSDAFELYQRLRRRGQSSTLARLSVESRLGDLPAQERRRVHRALVEAENKRHFAKPGTEQEL